MNSMITLYSNLTDANGNYPQELETMKEEFLSVMKHEFRTPLVIINGYCEILTELLPKDNLTKDQLDSINGIAKGIADLDKLTTKVLDLYALETKMVQFDKQQINIKEFMVKFSTVYSGILDRNDVKLINSVSDNYTITYDPHRLWQVLEYLIENALGFIPKKSGIVEIGSKNTNEQIILFVKDNGSGIPYGETGKLFQKFYQVDSSKRRRHFGLGLGLPICKEIIEQLGGKIWIETKEGVGTTVYFSIPK
mgnify:CR=1 FL=1